MFSIRLLRNKKEYFFLFLNQKRFKCKLIMYFILYHSCQVKIFFQGKQVFLTLHSHNHVKLLRHFMCAKLDFFFSLEKVTLTTNADVSKPADRVCKDSAVAATINFFSTNILYLFLLLYLFSFFQVE